MSFKTREWLPQDLQRGSQKKGFKLGHLRGGLAKKIQTVPVIQNVTVLNRRSVDKTSFGKGVVMSPSADLPSQGTCPAPVFQKLDSN